MTAIVKKKILLVEDDPKIGRLLTDFLKTEYQITLTPSPSSALTKVKKEDFDLAILDVMLPEFDGFELCKKIRAISSLPIIILTARGDTFDKIVGLEIGADDYLSKPFEPRELSARIKAILRRTRIDIKQNQEKIVFVDLVIDLVKRTAYLKNVDLQLTTMEFNLLELFAKNPQRVFSRDKLTEHLRGEEFERYNRSVDILISRLREKFHDDAKNPQFIKTVWGAGYIFVAAENP